MTAQSGGATPEYVSYAEFGLAFFERAVSEQRILAAVSSITGAPIEFGPIAAGPAKIAKARARGQVGDPVLVRQGTGEPIRFLLRIPVRLRLAVLLSGTVYKFNAKLGVQLKLTARAAKPLTVVVDIEPPTKDKVALELQAEGIASSVIQIVGGMEAEVKRVVAAYIRDEIAKPEIEKARIIDLGPIIDSATY